MDDGDNKRKKNMMEDDMFSYGGGGNRKKSKKIEKPPQISKDIPANIKNIDLDWCNVEGVMREVIDQGDRRVCWTIPPTRSLSARLVIDKRFLPPVCLSALHLLVGLIDKVDSTGGLNNLEHLRKFMIDHGTVSEEECGCPQLALKMKNDASKSDPVLCTEKGKSMHNRTFKVEDLIILDKVDEGKLIQLVTKGPVAVSIDVHRKFSKFKGDGIYEGPKKGSRKQDQHMLLVYGYGTKLPEGIHFWRTQNSAGTKWGNNGYGKIIRKISRPAGEPSLFTCILYPALLDLYEGEIEDA
ncbi:hypothetical protein ARALYDRAFT_893147 [Arabidopsis lyrata subsp. lyrata]|uniref:Peptidase C1A papain C-terminal domain-containing protein n=1 Tax=Arabidopsis lyrata subsp. lyrata TaxID=81972 RepID=D7KU11_ARALL|nr:hypothetical protein ARALYDRAFT_893147 [Arabidopsis lyrata subsp. lyrata]